jgi:hypothetical protein
MHSDESWLSGLSRNILDTKSFASTESFFDLKARNPHAIKILFHSLQIIFIRVLGYSLFSMRFISFIFGSLTIFYFYQLVRLIFPSKSTVFGITLMLAIDVQFIYASHFARQEIILLFVLVYSLLYFLSNLESHGIKDDLFVGMMIGLSIGVHPNSFIISLPIGLIYIFYIFSVKKLQLKHLLTYVFVVALFALFFIQISRTLDPNFFTNYLAYGQSEFEVLSPITSKAAQIKNFYLKLFYGVSGTYYTPNIKIQLVLFAASLLWTVLKLCSRKHVSQNPSLLAMVLSILGVQAGTILIGRYNQTSIIFIFPLCYILVGNLLNNFRKPYTHIAMTLLAFILFVNTAINMIPHLNYSYDKYIQEISKEVPKDKSVLANLNTEYYFENGKLHDYRNLAFLRNHDMEFSDYIHAHHIEYIIYPEELDFIYQSRPRWNGIYGNLLYFEDLQTFLQDQCRLVHGFTDTAYGMRIVRYMGTKNWRIKVYKVKK